MAAVIFADKELCAKVDSVIHPLTMLEVKKKIAEAEKKGIYEYVFVEAALLIEAGYDKTKIAVECNGEIVSKASYPVTALNEADKLEVVSFVGGG